ASVGSISGSVINQVTGLGIPGVTIQLLTQLNTLVGQTTTAAGGTYASTNERAGVYERRQQLPLATGLMSVAALPGINGANIAGSTTALAVTVVAGVNSALNSFPTRRSSDLASVGSISGSVINQATGAGIPGVTILLFTQLNLSVPVGQTTTDA